MSLKEEYAKLKQLVADAEADVVKIDEKNQKAARPRLRKLMQEVKAQAQTIRVTALGGEAAEAGDDK